MCRLSVAVPVVRRAAEPLWQRAAAVWLALPRSNPAALPEPLRWQLAQVDLAIGCAAYGWRKAARCEHCLPASAHRHAVAERGYWTRRGKRRCYAVPAAEIDDAALHDWLERLGAPEDCLIIWRPCW